jgi:hypothetical protein
MVNKLPYKPSVKDIMDKYCEMFRGTIEELGKQKRPFQQSRQTQMGGLD